MAPPPSSSPSTAPTPPPTTDRFDRRFDPSPSPLSIHSAFTDGYPFLLTSTPSLRALNAATPTRTTPMLAFRPNIVVDGPPHLLPPWDEDYWKELRIEGQPLVATKPCQRCAVPTVHPDTGERDARYEPIATMREQQRVRMTGGDGQADGKVYFGMNCVQMKPEGVISVRGPGDGGVEEAALHRDVHRQKERLTARHKGGGRGSTAYCSSSTENNSRLSVGGVPSHWTHRPFIWAMLLEGAGGVDGGQLQSYVA